MLAGNLPEDLIVEILLKFPVKSLFRFRCVHITWNSFIKSPSFIANHLKNSRIKYHGFVISDGKNQPYLTCKKWFKSFTSDTFDVCLEHKLPFQPHHDWLVKFVGTCNGLLCFYDLTIRNILLYNPSTNDHRFIPFSDVGYSNKDMAFGFGYDSINNCYKIVKVVGGHKNGRSRAGVCTLGKDSSFRNVGLPNKTIRFRFYSFRSIFLNGAMYWLRYYNNHVGLIRFDVCSEEFYLTPLPDCVSTMPRHYCMKLCVYGGLLSVINPVRRENNKLAFEIWVMEKTEINSWYKLQVFDGIITPQKYPVLLGFGMNGKLILGNGSGIKFYDTDGNEESKETGLTKYDVVVTYQESLVSLEGTFND